jgi:hypothetical protein
VLVPPLDADKTPVLGLVGTKNNIEKAWFDERDAVLLDWLLANPDTCKIFL